MAADHKDAICRSMQQMHPCFKFSCNPLLSFGDQHRSVWRVARPIATRRAGLLGWVAPPNGGINFLFFASGCRPVRFDLDHSLFSGQIVIGAPP
jgi:hypothetical protein